MLNFLFTKTPLVFLVQSFWRDEAYSYLLAKKNLMDIVALTIKDFSPPLYYFILHFWIKIFGNSEIALRSLSFIFFWATIYVVFLILNEVFRFEVKKSLIYLLFFVTNPILVYFAFEVRMYSLFAFLATLSYYALLKKNPRLYIISTILGLYTHYFMILVVVGQFIVTRFKQKHALFAFLPWLAFVTVNKVTSGYAFWIEKISPMKFVTFMGELFTGYEESLGFFDKKIVYFSLAISTVVLFSLVTYFKNKKNDGRIFWTLFIWGVVIPLFVLVGSFFKPLFLPRYLIFSSVGLCLLMVYAFEKMPVYVKAFAIAFFIAFSINYQKIEIAKRTKAPMRQTFAEIKNLIKDGDSVYVLSELDFFTAQYYVDEKRVYVYGKTYEEIPDYIGKVLLNEDRIAKRLPIYPNKAFVIDQWGNYEIEAQY